LPIVDCRLSIEKVACAHSTIDNRQSTVVIGILGGTFAPIHNGHLRLAIEAREQLGLEHVRLVPAGQPPLREEPAIPAVRRLHWVRLAIDGERGLVADGCEVRRAGPSYTVDTLAEVRAEHPQDPICLLLGNDAAQHLPQWHRWEALVEYAHLVLFNRPGPAPELPAAVARLLQDRRARSIRSLHQEPAGLCWRVEMPPVAASASDIRRRLRAGLSVRGLVPDAVRNDFNPKDLEAFGRA
jgi:nicotinate-nucleotide adenylyltransferase